MATKVIWGEKQVCCKTFYKSFFYVTNKVCSNKSLPCCHRIVFQAHSMSFTRKHQLFIFLLCSKPVFSTLVKIIYTFFKLPNYLAPIPFNNFLTLLKSISLTCNYIQLILLTCFCLHFHLHPPSTLMQWLRWLPYHTSFCYRRSSFDQFSKRNGSYIIKRFLLLGIHEFHLNMHS